MDRHKVIIVGGGPAGAMTALALTHFRPELAAEILLLEARSFPREKICGGGVSGRVVAFLEEVGVTLQKLAKVPVERFTICFDRDAFDAPFHNDKCFVVRRSTFDDFLLHSVRERGVEVRAPLAAVGAFREPNGIAVLDAIGTVHRSRILVGADGVNGRTRLWFGKPHRSRKTLLLQTDFPRDPEMPSGDSLIFDFTPLRFGRSGYAWFFPSMDAEGAPVINAGISGGPFVAGSLKQSREIFKTILDAHPAIKETAPERFHLRPYPEQDFSPFSNQAGNHVLLVGEQLGVDAFTGEGLAVCADSAAAAAQEILIALETGDYGFKGYSKRLISSDFFPLYLIGRPFWLESPGRRPNLLFSMATRKSHPGKENIMEIYGKLFSGALPAGKVFSPYFIKPVLRDLPPALLKRLFP
ncbi:MAG: hypothetical protein A2W01_03105 [Candidatus Solincola sediminis]|nr:MAG: hypothetical protein A2W01_03105 [Candidatus Solincola sediminis]